MHVFVKVQCSTLGSTLEDKCFSFFSTDWRWQWWRTSNSAVTAFIAKRPRVAYSCFRVGSSWVFIANTFSHHTSSQCCKALVLSNTDCWCGEKKVFAYSCSYVLLVTCRCRCVYMQMTRCQRGKSSRLLCRRNGSFPVVTVTNLFANRSTLNSCNFVVSWRIELKFVALESWRVSFFNNVSFVAKRWGLKNHPRSVFTFNSNFLNFVKWSVHCETKSNEIHKRCTVCAAFQALLPLHDVHSTTVSLDRHPLCH